ncbi:MAG: tetratricopeptide repeat protein [Ignavibacteriales bacterium]
MTAKKKLGMGLDLLLSAVETGSDRFGESMVPTEIKSLYEAAVDQDEKDNSLEAYHLYRRVTEIYETLTIEQTFGVHRVVSQAFNNLAIILYENGQPDQAIKYLKRALEIWPENTTAQENFAAIKEGQW